MTVRLYPGGRHEMLHETNRREVMEDLLDWMEERMQEREIVWIDEN